jgi:hypothetical protein
MIFIYTLSQKNFAIINVYKELKPEFIGIVHELSANTSALFALVIL